MTDNASKVMSMRDAVSRFVHDGDTVVIEGFTHLICFAAGHEIIRQRRRDLTLARLTPDLIYDQMIAAGCARKLVFSWAGNPGVGSLHAFRGWGGYWGGGGRSAGGGRPPRARGGHPPGPRLFPALGRESRVPRTAPRPPRESSAAPGRTARGKRKTPRTGGQGQGQKRA